MINDETLLLYALEDGLSERQRNQVRDALSRDPVLSENFSRLMETLGTIKKSASTVEPSDAMMSAWHTSLEREMNRSRSVSRWKRFGLGSVQLLRPAMFALVVTIFLAGWFAGVSSSDRDLQGPSSIAVSPPESPPENFAPSAGAVFVRGVSRHFEHTQIQLASLESSPPEERHALVEQIVIQNRFYLRLARQQGADDVARLLRAFEPLLLDIAEVEQDEDKIARSREQLEFELGVTLTKLELPTSNKVNKF